MGDLIGVFFRWITLKLYEKAQNATNAMSTTIGKVVA